MTVDERAFADLIKHAAHGCHDAIGLVTQLLNPEEGHVLALKVITYLIETAAKTVPVPRAEAINIVMTNVERLLRRENDNA